MSRHGLQDAGDEVRGRHFDWQLFLRFLEAVRPYRRSAWASLALLPILAGAKLVQPFLVKEAIDRAIVPGRLELLALFAGLFLLALVIETAFLYLQVYLVQAVGQRIMADLRGALFARLLRLPARFYGEHPSGRLVTRLTGDVENVGELFGAGIISALGDILSLVLIVGVMFWMNAQLALVALLVIPPLFVVATLFRRNLRRASRQVRARQAGLNAYIAERVAGIAEVRLFSRQKKTLEEFETLQNDYCQSAIRVINWDAALYAIVEALGSAALAAILWYGGIEAIAGTLTFGTLVAFIEYAQKFFNPLRDLSAKYSVVQTSNASLERIYDLLDQPVESGGDRSSPAAGVLEIDAVSFSYDSRTPVLDKISLSLAPGETIALVGDSGSGKTTLTRLIMAFYRPDSGVLRYDGVDLADLDPQLWRQHLGWVGQEPYLFSGSLRSNLDPHQRLDDAALLGLCVRCGCRDLVDRLGGLDAIIAERGRNLSSGERQLCCLVRALSGNPRLLILDEATSRLDPASESVVRRGLAAAGKERAVILVAHRLASARHADTIVVMRHGRIREVGTHTELLALNGLYARLWRLQQIEGADSAAPNERV